MSENYDIVVNEDGHKFRIYNQPESVVRELGIAPATREHGMTVGEALETLADMKRRVAILNQQRSDALPAHEGNVEYVTERTSKGQLVGYATSNDTGDDLAGVIVDRKNGKVWRV